MHLRVLIWVTWVTLTLGLLLPASAEADITCARPGSLTDVELRGLPRAPEAAKEYRVTLDLPRRHAISPHPRLLILRCPRVGSRNRGDLLDEVPGVDTGEGTYAFAVRFARPGRWRMVAFDRSGLFHDLGFLNVATPMASNGSGEADNDVVPLLIVVAGLAAGSAAVLVTWRRRTT